MWGSLGNHKVKCSQALQGADWCCQGWDSGWHEASTSEHSAAHLAPALSSLPFPARRWEIRTSCTSHLPPFTSLSPPPYSSSHLTAPSPISLLLLLTFKAKCMQKMSERSYLFFPVCCLDQHVQKSPESVALIWERDEPGTEVRITYRYSVCPDGSQLRLSARPAGSSCGLAAGKGWASATPGTPAEDAAQLAVGPGLDSA